MTQLPNDILDEIFLHLHQIDKVECMRVCHHWKRIMESKALYHTVALRWTSSLNMLATKIKENPEISKKIQRFIILASFTDSYKIAVDKVLSSLSNLRLLCSVNYFPDIIHGRRAFDSRTQYPWCKSIEYLDYHMKPVIFHLLTSYICPNLTTLFANLDEEKKIIHLLNHAPGLKNLKLLGGKISFSDLNTLHENTPLLDSLSLIYMLIDVTEYDEKAYYPTTIVTKCYYSPPDLKEFQTVIQLLVYISKKHPDLSELGIRTTYDTNNLNDVFLKNIYTKGWAPFFRNAGLTLKKLCFFSMGVEFSSFFELLDMSGCQISHLDIPIVHSDTIQNIARSQQIHFIETLALDFNEFQSHEWLNKLYVLKNLELYGFMKHVQLEDIIIHFPPTLKSLTLKDTFIMAPLDYTKKSPLETLNFQGVHFPEGMDVFINQVFPNLSKLYLMSWREREAIWVLPNINLSVFQFGLRDGNENYNILIETHNNNKSQLYTVMDSIFFRGKYMFSSSYERPYKLCASNKSNNTSAFTLCCHSLKDIIFSK